MSALLLLISPGVSGSSGGGGGGGGLTVSVSPFSAYGEEFGSGTVVSNSVTATPSGGTAPYTYLWENISFGDIEALTPTSASTVFRKTFDLIPSESSEDFRLTVTDADSNEATIIINVTLAAFLA
jgi:hypothetical protein